MINAYSIIVFYFPKQQIYKSRLIIKNRFYFLLLKIENIFELFIQINRMIKNTSLDIKIILKTYLKIH